LEQAQFEEDQKGAKKDVAKAQKDVIKAEKAVKRKQKESEEKVSRRDLQIRRCTNADCSQRPDLVAMDAKMAHASKKMKAAEDNAKTIERDLLVGEGKLAQLNKDLAVVQKAAAAHEGEFD
jgi:structural maintenance of chromosome 1